MIIFLYLLKFFHFLKNIFLEFAPRESLLPLVRFIQNDECLEKVAYWTALGGLAARHGWPESYTLEEDMIFARDWLLENVKSRLLAML